MSGGHFSQGLIKSKNFTYLPLLRRIGNSQIVRFLQRTSFKSSSNSSDPTLIPKPTDDPDIANRVVKIVQIQTGKYIFDWKE